MQQSESKLKPNLLFGGAFLFILYLTWVSVYPIRVFWSLDEGGKYIHLWSILQTGKLNTPLLYPARPLDPNLERVPLYYYIQKGNELYSWWPIALPLVSLPFYRLLGWLGLFILPALGGALTASLTGWLVWRLSGSSRLGWLALVLTGVATPVAFYATRFWEHTLSTACIMAAFVAMLEADRAEQWHSAVWAGVFGSLAVFFRLDAVFLILGAGVALFLRRPRIALAMSGITFLTALPWIMLNQWTGGNPFGPTFNKLIEAPPLSGWQKAGWKLIAYALFNPPRVDGFIFPRWAILTASLGLLVGVGLAWIRNLRGISLVALGTTIAICGWVAFQPTWYQAVHGFVLAAPQVLFAGYFVLNRRSWRERPFFVAAIVASTLIYGVVYLWRAWIGAGGLQWGPRYLLAFYPLLIAAALLELKTMYQEEKPHIYYIAVLLFATASIIGTSLSVRGLLTARQLTEWYDRGKHALLHLDAPLVLEWPGYIMDVPDLYFSGDVVVIPPIPELRQRWESFLRTKGFTHYYTGDLMTVDNAPLEVIMERMKTHPEGVALSRIDLTGR